MDPGSVPEHGAVADRAAATRVGPTKDIRRCISCGVETLDHSAALATDFGVFADHWPTVCAEHARVNANGIERSFGERLDCARTHQAFAVPFEVGILAVRRVVVESFNSGDESIRVDVNERSQFGDGVGLDCPFGVWFAGEH